MFTSILKSHKTFSNLFIASITITIYIYLIFYRIIPNGFSDRAIFIAVAERINLGDRLYIDVWDNKDPIFYYLWALARNFHVFGEIFLENSLILSTSFFLFLILKKIELSKINAFLISAILAPIIITAPGFYHFGYTHTPGILLLTAILYFCFEGFYFMVGILMGILFFTKLIMLPTSIPIITYFLWFNKTRNLDLSSNLQKLIIGFFITFLILISILFIRGEFLGYLNTQIDNISYSNGPIIASKGFFLKSFSRFKGVLIANQPFQLIFSFQLGFCLFLILSSYGFNLSSHLKKLSLLNLFILLANILILSLTGIWDHHASIFLFGSLYCLILLNAFLDEISKKNYFDFSKLIFSVIIIVPVTGITDLNEIYRSHQKFKNGLDIYQHISPEVSSLIEFTNHQEVEYARIGQNTDLRQNDELKKYKLYCANFHQYAFDSPQKLDQIFECAAKAPYLVISEKFQMDTPDKQGPPYSNYVQMALNWNRFVAKVELLLKYNFDCKIIIKDGPRVCKQY